MTATASQAKPSREPKRGVPRRFRKDNERAKKNEEEYLDGVERGVILQLPPRPDPPARPPRVPLRDREKLPVLRPVMRNPKGELKATGAVVANRIAVHACRLDLHARRCACSAGRGTRRLAFGVRDYVQMPDSLRVLAELSDGTHPDSKEHAKMARKYNARRKARWSHVKATAAVAGPVALIGFVLLWLLVHQLLTVWWTIPSPVVAVLSWIHLDRLLNGWASIPLLLAVAMSGLAYYGRHRDKAPGPIVQVDNRPVQRIEGRPSADKVYLAFRNSGIDGIACDPPHRAGPGWETTVVIPLGTQTFRTAGEKHAAIAGNIGTGSEGLFLERGETEKHVIVWWSTRDPFGGPPTPNPILDARSGPLDLWNDGLEIGVDPRGTPVRIPVVDTPFMAFGGQPRSGKTFGLFDVCAGIAADPIWDLDCWSFKASNDFGPVEPLVRACGGTFRYGANDDTFKAFLRYLKGLRLEIVARNERLADLPLDRNPHAKVERDVAADPAFGMRPRIVIMDEIQTVLPYPGVLDELIELGRIAPSQNVVGILGFQWVDRETIQKFDRAIGARVCLSVVSVEDSRGVLGGAHEPGIAEGHKIPLSAKGVAVVAGAVEDDGKAPRGAFKMRFYGVSSRQALADHVARCLAGCRSGQAPVQLAKTDDPARERLAAAMNGDRRLGLDVLAERLGHGDGNGALRKAAADARAAGVEPITETRDTGGVVPRGAKYVDLDQLNGRNGHGP